MKKYSDVSKLVNEDDDTHAATGQKRSGALKFYGREFQLPPPLLEQGIEI